VDADFDAALSTHAYVECRAYGVRGSRWGCPGTSHMPFLCALHSGDPRARCVRVILGLLSC